MSDYKNESFKKLEFGGRVVENNTKVDTNDAGVEYLTGDLVVKFGEDEQDIVRVDVYQPSQSNGGKENKAFSNNVKFLDELVTVDKATDDNPATLVGAGGNFPFCPTVTYSPYYSVKNSEYGKSLDAELGYSTKLQTVKEDEVSAQFQIEGLVLSVPWIEELNGKDVLKIPVLCTVYGGKKGTFVPTVNEITVHQEEYFDQIITMFDNGNLIYNEVMPEDFTILDEADSDNVQNFVDEALLYFNDLIDSGKKVGDVEEVPVANFSGKPSLARIKDNKTKSALIGADVEETSAKFYSELTFTGLVPAEEVELEDFVEALNNYQEYLEKIKQDAEDYANKKSGGSSSKSTSSSRRSGRSGRSDSSSSSRRRRR